MKIWILLIFILGIITVSGCTQQYGFSSSADAIVQSSEECDNYCKENGYWGSGNIYDSSSKECFCWKEPPEKPGLEELNLEECEKLEPEFQDSCYLSYARRNKDNRYCEKVSSWNRDFCYSEVERASQ